MKKTNKYIIIINLVYIFIIIYSFSKDNISFYFQSDKIDKIDENNKLLLDEITNTFKAFNKVNINEIESKILHKKEIYYNVKSTINIGFTLNTKYILETKLTSTSIMATQKKTTKIRFHFGVTQNFTSKDMLELYELKSKINNLTEFNFYYLKESVEKMRNFHPKGEACPGKFELPTLLSDDIERLIIFDAGDLLVFRDLTDLYNYNMEDYWALGNPEPNIIETFMIVKYNITKYINIGSILLNVKKLKENKFWDIYTKNRNLEIIGAPDQTLFNILVPDNKKNFLPFRFGGFSILTDDSSFDSMKFIEFGFDKWLNSNLSISLPENPQSEKGILANMYNPRFFHQFNGKWERGNGLTIYRLLNKYFMNLAGITNKLCKKKPGYCK